MRRAPGQEGYVGLYEDWPKEMRAPENLHVIDDGDGPVGFFRIDPAFDLRVPSLTKGSHGLRGLLIDARLQGRGLGRSVMEALPVYLSGRFPGLRHVFLTVDAPNDRAHRLYRGTGWLPHGPDHAGDNGIEYVLRLDLPGERPGQASPATAGPSPLARRPPPG